VNLLTLKGTVATQPRRATVEARWVGKGRTVTLNKKEKVSAFTEQLNTSGNTAELQAE